MNFSDIRDIPPGSAIFFDHNREIHMKRIWDKPHSPCLFEWVYFARPDSIIDGVNVYRARVHLGELLAEEIRKAGLPIDIVVPIPDSARDAAIEIARKLNLKYREALVKNRYIGRTFIMPAVNDRQNMVRFKLNPIAAEFKDRNVLLVDDSIVRGNTARAIVGLVRDCGARNVYFASCSPPLRYPCVYGVDMQTRKEFVARDRNEEEVALRIGADRVIYQTQENLVKAIRMENPNLGRFCAACFDGNYITGDVTPEMLQSIEDQRRKASSGQMELNIT
jgi:amidophosphoribosyltransferase